MGKLARFTVGTTTAVVAALLLSACATTGTGRIASPHGLIAENAATAAALGAPRVHISTEHEATAFRRIRTRIRAEDDAYVLVVNVAPDGGARVIFPETPQDNGLLRGNTSYALPQFFAGYPSMALETATTTTRFVMVGRSALASPGIRGPGYTFVLASREPFNMKALEEQGLFDWAEVGYHLEDYQPDVVVPMIAEIALQGAEYFVVATDVARYAGYSPHAGVRDFAFASHMRGVLRSCNTIDLLFSARFFSNGMPPAECYNSQGVIRLVQRPRTYFPPPQSGDTTAQEPPDSATAESWRRFKRVRPEDAELVRPQPNEVELDRTTREQMLRRQKLEERQMERERHVGAGSDGVRRRPQASRDVEGSRPSRSEAPRSESPRPTATDRGSPRSEPASTGEPSRSSTPSSSSSGSSDPGSSRPTSQMGGRP